MDDKLKKQAEICFIRARIDLLKMRPFYGHLVLKLRLEWLENVPGGLSCTDGEALYINPVEFVKLSKGGQSTVLVHEVLHCACGHLWRQGSRDPRKWNVAADCAIYHILRADGFEEISYERALVESLRKSGVNMEQFAGQFAEAIYTKLPDSPPQCGCGGCFRDKPGESRAAKAEAEATWKAHVVAAGQLAGSQPGAWSELVKAATPKPPFHLKLFEYLTRGLGGESTWSHLNRRMVWRGMYLPTDTKQVMGRVAWVADTSGSMCSKQLAKAFGYFRGFREAHPCLADLICCDYGVASHRTYAEHERLPETFEVKGRGGTSFNAPFEMLREKRIEPRLLVYATDAYGECSVKKPPYPVLWLIIGGDQDWRAPFGEVVRVPVQ
jgi:predicted metal-dependent peptidase